MDPIKGDDGQEQGAGSFGDEAQWALTTARTLQARGDIDNAVVWYRRAVQHLMEAGEDEQALEIARLAAGLSAPPPTRSTTSSVPAARATSSSMPAARSSIASTPPGRATTSSPPAARVTTAGTPAARITTAGTPAARATTSSPPPAMPPSPVLVHSTPGSVPPGRVQTRPSRVPPSIAAMGERESIEQLTDDEPSSSGEVSAQESMDLLRALRSAISFQPMRAVAAEHLATRIINLPLFREMPGETVRAIARQSSLVTFEPGELMLTPGHAGPEPPLYVVLDGRGVLRAVGDEGPGTPLGVGDFIGEIPALYGGRCVMSASVREPVTAMALPRSLVNWLAREFPGLRVTLEEAAWERAFASIGRGSPFLRRLPPDQRGLAYSRFEPVILNPGDLMLGEGAPPLAFWIVAAGEVEVYGGGIHGAQPRRAQAGDAIGLRAILEGEPSGISARTLGMVLAAKVGINSFRVLLDKHPSLADAVEDIGIPGRAVVC